MLKVEGKKEGEKEVGGGKGSRDISDPQLSTMLIRIMVITRINNMNGGSLVLTLKHTR